MKKFLSVVLALATVLTMSVCLFSVSAASLKPTNDLKTTKVISCTFMKAMAQYNTTSVFDGSVGDSLNPCEGLTAFGNKTAAETLGACTWGEAGTRYTAFSEKVAEGHDVSADANFNSVILLGLGSAGATVPELTKISSLTLVVPAAASKVGGCVPDGFTLYYSTSTPWFSTADNEESKINLNKANYKYLCTVSDLIKDAKYVEADGYRFYECNLPQTVEAKYLLLLFSKEFDFYTKAANRADNNANNTPTAYAYISEFGVFSNEIQYADVAGTNAPVHVDTTAAPETTASPETAAPATTVAPETAAPETKAPETTAAAETKPTPSTGDTSFVLIAVAAVAVVASAAVILRKKEED